jgi:cytochrome c
MRELLLVVLSFFALPFLMDTAYAQDVAAGKHLFDVCAPCHATDQTNGAGPALFGVVGRTSGSVPGFRYSRAMKNAHLLWNANTLDEYIAAPQKVVPGNLMPFSGIANPSDRANLIAYLETLK